MIICPREMAQNLSCFAHQNCNLKRRQRRPVQSGVQSMKAWTIATINYNPAKYEYNENKDFLRAPCGSMCAQNTEEHISCSSTIKQVVFWTIHILTLANAGFTSPTTKVATRL